jgi:putative tryptophan/tyrosine transport system substrate-binding protein
MIATTGRCAFDFPHQEGHHLTFILEYLYGLAGARSDIRLDSPPAILSQVPMRLIGLAVVLTVGLVLAPLAAVAQQAGKVYRIGVLSSGSSIFDDVGRGSQAFREQLSDLGWVVGQNLTFEPRRSADQRLDRLPGLAAERVQLNVSMILAFGNEAALAAKRATATIPIVMVAGDPVGSGLVASLARSGGNITGLTNEAGLEIFSRQLELLKEAAPKISRVGILANRSVREATVPTTQALRLTFLPVEVRSPSDFDDAFAVLIRARVDALMATGNRLNVEHRGSIVSFAAGNRLPTVFGERAFVDAGGLMSYGISTADLLRRLPSIWIHALHPGRVESRAASADGVEVGHCNSPPPSGAARPQPTFRTTARSVRLRTTHKRGAWPRSRTSS